MEELLGLYLLAKFRRERTDRIMEHINSLIEVTECDTKYIVEFFDQCVRLPIGCFTILFKRWDKIKNEKLREELLKTLGAIPGVEIIYQNTENTPKN